MDAQRFIQAQGPVYAEVLDELRAGNKTTHWMWFIFPQLLDLGRSPTARYYGLANLTDAKHYLAYPVLGARLKDCTSILLKHSDKSVLEMLHKPDHLKFCSCMTLFKLADPAEPLFQEALDTFCRGQMDDMTVQLVNRMSR